MTEDNVKNVIILTTPDNKLECWSGIARLCKHHSLPLGTIYQYMSTKKGDFAHKNFKFKKVRVR